MKKVLIKKISATIAILTLGVFAVGCGAKGDSNLENNNDKIKITVGTGANTRPFTYVNEQNELVGYDIEVVKEVFNKLPQYEVSFEKTEFASVLTGLDSDRYQIAANNFALNKVRQEKYIYSDPILKNQYVIVVPKGNNDIKSFEDLVGKTTELRPSNNYTTAIKNYNEENPSNPVKITYTEADLLPILQHVESGQYDFQLIEKSRINQYIDEYGLKVDVIDLSEDDANKIAAPYSYLIISKGNEELAENINQALSDSIEDGTLAEISKKYFNGVDYAPYKE